MGIYLNPGNENFAATLTREIYVDKTQMISVINHFMATDNKYVCVSRPRRFGKTIATNMIAAYFSKGCDSKKLFTPYKIASSPDFETNLNKQNVIKIDVNSEYQNIENKDNVIRKVTRLIRDEIKNEFPSVSFEDTDTLGECIQKVYTATKETFVILLDEYDILVREKVSEKLFSEYLGFLNGLFKSDTLRPAISLAYLTGILPIVRDRVQSKLNNFEEYTILDADELAEFVGFTDEEVHMLCDTHNVNYEECKRWYDGYSQHGYEIYNPESVVMCIRRKRFSDYWSRTSTYAAIAERIMMNFAGTKDDVIKMLAGESIDVNVTRFMNTLDSFSSKSDVFTYLIHIGYLAYDVTNETCKIPNKEIRNEWFNAIEANPDYEVTDRIIQSSKELLSETLAGNEKAVSDALDVSHIHVTSNRSYNNEDGLQSAIYLAFIYALNKYTVIKEMTTGKGFADVVFIPFIPDIPALIIELKRNSCVESAITQIKDKQYFDSLAHYSGDLLFIGINYDETTKKHECKIERFIK